MGLTEDIWKAFAAKMGLTLVANFGFKVRKYQGWEDSIFTKDEIVGTPEYRAFTQGFCRNEREYQGGPKGTLATAIEEEPTFDTIITTFLSKAQDEVPESMLPSGIREGVEQRLSNPSERDVYNEYYDMGLACSPGPRTAL